MYCYSLWSFHLCKIILRNSFLSLIRHGCPLVLTFVFIYRCKIFCLAFNTILNTFVYGSMLQNIDSINARNILTTHLIKFDPDSPRKKNTFSHIFIIIIIFFNLCSWVNTICYDCYLTPFLQNIHTFWYEFSTDTLHTQNVYQNVFSRFIRDVEILCYLSSANMTILKNGRLAWDNF